MSKTSRQGSQFHHKADYSYTMNHPPKSSSDEGSVAGTRNVPADSQPQLLLPTKVNHFVASDGSRNIAHEAFPRGQASRWTAQPVLDWLGSLAAATEANDRRGPMLVGATALSQPSPPLPNGVVHSQKHSANDHLYASSLSEYDTNVKPRLWDISYIDHHDSLAWSSTCQISSLAVQLESMAGQTKTSPTQVPTTATEHLMAAYQQLQIRVEFTFGRIVGQQQQHSPHHQQFGTNTTADAETRKLLDALYQETIDKLQSLIADYHPYAKPHPLLPPKLEQSQPYPTKNPVMPKQEFAKYMTTWLRDNWTNPYPDDQGVTEMAAHCGTTTQVISNWLINARTRKWRPALVKATELGRPSDLLLEDSINLFDGKPVRDINPDDYYHQQQQQQQQQQFSLSHQQYNNEPSLDDSEDDHTIMDFEPEEPHSKRFRSDHY